MKFASVRIGLDGLAEMDGPRRLLFIPRTEIRAIELVYTSAAERPVLTVLLGVAMLLLGLFPFVFLFFVFRFGGEMEGHIFYVSVFGVVGVWLLWFALKSRNVLLVHTPGGTRKLAFHSSGAREDIVRFVTEAAPRFGYSISFPSPG